MEQDEFQAVAWYHKAVRWNKILTQHITHTNTPHRNTQIQMYQSGEKDYKKHTHNQPPPSPPPSKAEQGLAATQHKLGVMYETGKGVPVDDTQAATWYRKAADQGHPSAQFSLGLMYQVFCCFFVCLFLEERREENSSAQFYLGLVSCFVCFCFVVERERRKLRRDI